MPADSLFGGSADNLSAQSLALLNAFLTDTVKDSTTLQFMGSGAAMVIGSGSNGEKQGAITPPVSSITATMDDGVLKLSLNIPALTGVLFEGKDNVTPAAASSFLGAIVEKYLGSAPVGSPEAAQKNALLNAIDNIVTSLTGDVVVRMVDFMRGGTTRSGAQAFISPDEMFFDAGTSAGTQLFAVNLGSTSRTVALQNVEAAVLAGNGAARIEGNAAARLQGDAYNQHITGGGGNDTLVGGGGNDTLAGGAGADVFGFTAFGHYTINDFDKAQDKLAFKIGLVQKVADLVPHISRVVDTPTSVTYHFGPDASITLVGVSSADITADMVKFTL